MLVVTEERPQEKDVVVELGGGGEIGRGGGDYAGGSGDKSGFVVVEVEGWGGAYLKVGLGCFFGFVMMRSGCREGFALMELLERSC